MHENDTEVVTITMTRKAAYSLIHALETASGFARNTNAKVRAREWDALRVVVRDELYYTSKNNGAL